MPIMSAFLSSVGDRVLFSVVAENVTRQSWFLMASLRVAVQRPMASLERPREVAPVSCAA